MKIIKHQILLLNIFLFLFSGCMSEAEFHSYEDKDKKGSQVFVKDLKNCRQIINQEKRPSEGSEGAGEKQIRKMNLIRVCMENENWILKK
jgi:hypothetical protein